MTTPSRILQKCGPLLLFGMPIGCALIWAATAGYEGLNGQDAHDYLHIAKGWTAWSHGGPRPEVVEHPHGYPMAGAILGAVLGSDLLALRSISAFSLIVLAFLLRGLLRMTSPDHREVDTFVLLAVVLSPFMLRYSLMVMSDVPAMMLVFGAFVCAVQWLKHGRWKWFVLALMVMASAFSVRLAAAPLLFPMLLALVHGPSVGRKLRWGIATLFLAIVIVLFAFNATVLFNGTSDHPLSDWSFWNFFRRELHSDDGTLTYTFPNTVHVLGIIIHPGFLPMGLLLIPFVRRMDLLPAPARVAALTLVFYLLFIAGLPFQNDRVLLSALPFVIVLLFPAFTRAIAWWETRVGGMAWGLAVLVAIQIALFVRAMIPFFDQARVERELASEVNALQPTMVYTHGMGAAFVTYCPGITIQELWYGDLEHFESGAVFVVRPSNLSEQWEGRPPATNWQRAHEQGLQVLEERPDGWVFARVR